MTTKWFLQKISKLRKDEIALSALLLVLTFVLNVLYIRKFYGVYCPLISGYDPYLLSTLTNWIHSPYLNSNSIYSHPGFGIIMAPLSVLNYILSFIAGSNCADFVLAIILMTMFILETILIKRIINEYIGLKLALSLILSIFFQWNVICTSNVIYSRPFCFFTILPHCFCIFMDPKPTKEQEKNMVFNYVYRMHYHNKWNKSHTVEVVF